MDEFERGIDSASKKFDEFSNNFEKNGKKISDIGSSMTTKITLPLAGFATAAGKMSMDFENAMAKVGTIADTSVVPLEILESAIISLSNETGVASSDIAESVYNVISATGDTAGAVDLVRNATQLATAGFTDSESAMSVLTTAMNAYGLSAQDATKISDSLIMTQNLGVTTVADLSSNMGRAIATASAYGVGLENLEAGYVALTKSGINTAEGTTYLSSMFNELGKAGGDVSKILQEQTGMSFGQLMDSGYSLADVLGILYDSTGQSSEGFINLWSSAEAGKAANAIVNQGLQEFNTNLETISGSMGTTQSAYETMQTNSFNLGKAINELKNAVTELGNVLVPIIVPAFTAIVEKATAVVEWFTNLDEGTQKLILTIAGIAAVAGPVLLIAGKIISAIGTIVGAISGIITAVKAVGAAVGGLFALLAANPIGLVIAAIAALVAAFVALWNNCEGFRDFWIGLWDGLKSVVSKAAGAIADGMKQSWENTKKAWNSAKEFFGGVWDNIKDGASKLATAVGDGMKKSWENTKNAWNTAKSFFSDVWNNVKEKASAAASAIGDGMKKSWENTKSAWSAAKGFFSGVWDNAKTGASKAGTAISDGMKKSWNNTKNAWNMASSFFAGVVEKITGAFSGIASRFMDIGGNIVGGLRDGISNAWSSFVSWISDKVGGLVEAVKNMLGIHSPSTVFAGIGGNMALGLAEGWSDEYAGIKRKIESGLNFGATSVDMHTNDSSAGHYGARNAAGYPGNSWGNTTVNIYSPEAVDAVQAARVWKKETQKMAIAYV